jgi:ribonucleoside-diphosphate reductase alpha chain
MRGDTAGPAEPEPEPTNGTNGQTNGGNGGHGSPARPSGEARSTEPKPAASALTDEPPAIPAKLAGLDLGPACAQCGGMMQRTGSCYTCSSCGNNPGCG